MKTFWINVTNNCNLHCLYCYQSLRNEKFLMQANADKIIEMMSKYSGDIVVTFFGGEPFLNFSIIQYMVEKILNIEYIKSHFNITTNLTVISEDEVLFIIENNISLMISLDGDQQTFNLNRFNKNNDINYFSIVIENMQYILESVSKLLSYRHFNQINMDAIQRNPR